MNDFSQDMRGVIYTEPLLTLLPGFYEDSSHPIHTVIYNKPVVIDMNAGHVIYKGETIPIVPNKDFDYIFVIEDITYHIGSVAGWASTIGLTYLIQLCEQAKINPLKTDLYIPTFPNTSNIFIGGPFIDPKLNPKFLIDFMFAKFNIDLNKMTASDKTQTFDILKQHSPYHNNNLPIYTFFFPDIYLVCIEPISNWLSRIGALNLL